MIVKSFELKKKNFKSQRYFLLYGANRGLKEESIEKILKPQLPNNISYYDENEILNNTNNFFEDISNRSFFENEKLIIIQRFTFTSIFN